jgi:hypothetical protein
MTKHKTLSMWVSKCIYYMYFIKNIIVKVPTLHILRTVEFMNSPPTYLIMKLPLRAFKWMAVSFEEFPGRIA